MLACNRGQTIGAQGNFTMFRFYGDGTSSENITFGNYCNVDLEFPLKPELSKKKRAEAIVQAQLIHCDGDKIVAQHPVHQSPEFVSFCWRKARVVRPLSFPNPPTMRFVVPVFTLNSTF
ncbi:MAG: hypothetical protein R2778_07445 [Saprospiraceae bacterium]